MPELRWTLLIVGALFIVGLALWEIRRQRQAPRQSGFGPTAPPGERTAPSIDGGGGSQPVAGFVDPTRVRNEPVITFPELQPVDSRREPHVTARREPTADPPVIEVDAASFSRLPVQGETGAIDPVEAAHDEDTIALSGDDVDDLDASLREDVARRAGVGFDGNGDDHTPHGADLGSTAASTNATAAGANGESPGLTHAERVGVDGSDSPQAQSQRGAANGGVSPQTASASGTSESVGFDTDTDDQHTPASRPAAAEPMRHEGASAAGAPIVDWPAEGARKIVALRLVSPPAARFQGRAVRLALAAEGFVLGKFDIFHKAGPDDRALLSAASLTKPGTFALNTMDGQRFGGLSLFAVLPGPLPPQETFDELLHTARALNDRLQGALQDERGEPLTPMRSAAIRQSLSEARASNGSGASAEPAQAAPPQSETRQ
ncbi:MAG TPA: cell division protein ZipA C-terminal FtsZ-binding domain-containing protein [Steroidobacteraceae bacterium]|nr:cell division protein ZipA C-terminal FtsZ-binding domain-containing protein [Steroidobacteraceae bacterium]